MKHRLQLLLLALLFAAPGVMASIFYHSQTLHPRATTNQGVFVRPQIQFASLGQAHRWHLLLLKEQLSDQHTLAELDQLYRTKLALGKRYKEVEVALLLGQDGLYLANGLTTWLRDKHIDVVRVKTPLPASIIAGKPKYFIADPDNYLILAYDRKTSFEAIYSDLKHLLYTTTRHQLTERA